ncbi:putative zinc transporter msc2 [Blastocladiella emersonii ATCC 22665]|nr:putative zinc transporter msc2 [Blastocladiella emersonii ATCC 22665]
MNHRSSRKLPRNPSLVWLHVAKAAKVLGLVTAQDLIREYSFSVAGLVFWALTVASLIAAAVARFPWTRVSRQQWPKLLTFAFFSWLRLWFTLEATKHASVLRVLMFTEYVGLWLPTVLAETKGRSDQTRAKHLGTLALLGAVALEFANDFGFTSAEVSFTAAAWTFIGCAIVTAILQARVKQTLVAGNDAASHDNLSLFAASTPLACAMSVVPYALFGHSSTALESHTLAHLTLWMVLLGTTLVALDALGNHSAMVQGAPLQRIATHGWRTAVACAAGLAAFHRFPTLFEIAGAVLFYSAIDSLTKSAPHVLAAAWAPAGGGAGLAGTSSLLGGALAMGPGGGGGAQRHGLGVYWRNYVKPIWESKDSRSIFIFLCINLSYMFVQLAYGVWTNSLGLISDAIHMFFDCIALAVGLFAALMAKWGASSTFTFGYNRVETLSGFGNGIFLVFISLYILIEGIERVIHPPEMNTERLLIVATVGFAVNMVGLFSFHDHHHHGHGGGDGGGCDHHHDNANMQGVFLHILADALGSVGVIISTLLIYQFGWTGFDPLASLLIAILIFASTIPLLSYSLSVLMNTVPRRFANALPGIHDDLRRALAGNATHIDHRIWSNDGGSDIHAAFRISLAAPPPPNVDEQMYLDAARGALAARGINKVTIEFVYPTGAVGAYAPQQQLAYAAPAAVAAAAGFVPVGAAAGHDHHHHHHAHDHGHGHGHGHGHHHHHHHDHGSCSHGHDHGHSHSHSHAHPHAH